VKATICPKKKFPYGCTEPDTFYSPSCLRYCKDLCGAQCKKKCNLDHKECKRGELDNTFLKCKGSGQNVSEVLPYVEFELVEIENQKEGKENFKRMDKVITDLTLADFKEKIKAEFKVYAEHVVAFWFLRNTKNAAFSPKYLPSHVLKLTSDFAENITIIKKWELSEQYFKRPEICLFGSVSGFMAPVFDEMDQVEDFEHLQNSHMVLSDYR
jgi:hypothetical protein